MGLGYLNNMEFTTFDADHDKSQLNNLAAVFGGGFWWSTFFWWQNVNGYYSGSNYTKWQKIYWEYDYNLLKTQLMIRPAAEN